MDYLLKTYSLQHKASLYSIFDLLFTEDNLDSKILPSQFLFCFENTTKAAFAEALYGVKILCKPAETRNVSYFRSVVKINKHKTTENTCLNFFSFSIPGDF